jgi:hypothetical protein
MSPTVMLTKEASYHARTLLLQVNAHRYNKAHRYWLAPLSAGNKAWQTSHRYKQRMVISWHLAAFDNFCAAYSAIGAYDKVNHILLPVGLPFNCRHFDSLLNLGNQRSHASPTGERGHLLNASVDFGMV